METSEGKVAVVTGGNKGLGYEIVKALCKKYDGIVYLTARSEERGRAACKKLQEVGLKPRFHQLDIQYGKSIHTLVKYLEEKHGGVDLLINNAGVLFLKNSKQPKVYQADQTLIVNFFSLIDFCETIAPLIRDGGSVVNVSSSSGHLSRIPSQKLRERLKREDLSLDELKVLMQSYLLAVKHSRDVDDGWGESPYVVSKVGVNAYTFMLHRRLESRDIKVNCVHPGYIRTDMTNGEGNIPPEQGAEVVVKVALSDSKGQYIWHDGTPVPWCGEDPRTWIDRAL